MADPKNYGAFSPTTFIWDSQRLNEIDVTSQEFKELLIRLYQNLNLMANVLNIKDSALYFQEEFVCGQLYYEDPNLSSSTARSPEPRQVFRKVIAFGALPNAGDKHAAHNITVTASTIFTRIYATASDTTNFQYIPIPYVDAGMTSSAGPPPKTLTPSPLGDVQIYVDANNVWIRTTNNLTNFDQCNVVLEYFKF